MTLIEVSVSFALLGLMGLALAAAMSLMSQIQQNSKAFNDAQSLESYLKMALTKPTSCFELLGMKGSLSIPAGKVFPTTAGSSIPISIYKHPATASTIFLGSAPALSPTGNYYGAILVQSVNLDIVQVSGNAASKLQLIAGVRLAMQKMPANVALGLSTFNVMIPVSIRVDAATGTGEACSAVPADLVVPQCPPGQSVVLSVQSGGPQPTRWSCQ